MQVYLQEEGTLLTRTKDEEVTKEFVGNLGYKLYFVFMTISPSSERMESICSG